MVVEGSHHEFEGHIFFRYYFRFGSYVPLPYSGVILYLLSSPHVINVGNSRFGRIKEDRDV